MISGQHKFMGFSLPPPSTWRARLGAVLKNCGSFGPILRNFAWLSGDKIVRMGIHFLVGAVIARHLGSAGFGILNVAFAATTLMVVLSSPGLDGILSRELLREPSQADLLLGTVFLMRLAAVILLCPVVAIVAFNETAESRTTFLISAVSLLFVPMAVFNTHFEVHLQARYTVWATNAAFVLCTVLRIWLVGIDASVDSFATTYVIEIAITVAILFFLYRKLGGRVGKWRWDLRLARSLLRQSWPLLFSGFAIMIYMRLDQIMLAKMRGDTEVGIFAAALRFLEIWYFISMALTSSLLLNRSVSKRRTHLDTRRRSGTFTT